MSPGPSLIRHYLQFKDLRAEEYTYLFDRMAIIKKKFKTYEKHQPLTDRTPVSYTHLTLPTNREV